MSIQRSLKPAYHHPDARLGEEHACSVRVELRFDRHSEIFCLRIERDDAERGRSRPSHAAGNERTLLRRFPVPATLILTAKLRDPADERPPRSLWSPARPREDVSWIPRATRRAPDGTFRRRSGRVAAGPR